MNRLVILSLLFCASALHLSRLPAGEAGQASSRLALVPWPKSIELAEGELMLEKDARIVASDDRLLPLATILSDEIFLTTGVRLSSAQGDARDGDVLLIEESSLGSTHEGAYELLVGDQVVVRGADHAAVARGTATLLQAIELANGKVLAPRMTIRDWPHFAYCGTLLDVARKPYSIETLKQCVDVCRFYKIRFIQLHLTDENAWTFPSSVFPELGSQNFAWAGGEKPTVYPLAQLKELVRYADERGVTFVPEMEVPGHSGQLRGTFPELFGYRNEQGESVALGVINMVNERAFGALDTLIGELCDVFRSSPYIHIGCDEASLGGMEAMSDVQEFLRQRNLSDPHEIFNLFVARMHEIVTRRGKRMIVWEGAPLGPRPLPKDIIFMPWVGGTGAAAELVRLGHPVINAPWGVEEPYFDPYLVNGAKLEPAEPLLLGATSILWESPEDRAVPYLCFTGALRNEPAYSPSLAHGLTDFLRRLERTSPRLDRLLFGFTFKAEGVLESTIYQTPDSMFDASVTLTLSGGSQMATVRYTLDGSPPSNASAAYSEPIRLNQTTSLKAGLFRESGSPAGAIFNRRYVRVSRIEHDAVGASVDINPPKPGYAGPGSKGLTDGLLAAGYDFFEAGWVGWDNNGGPVEITIDLGSQRKLETVSPHFLRAAGGVMPPSAVDFLVSDDNALFCPVGTVSIDSGTRQRGWYTAELGGVEARYLRISALPSGDWTFVDEVIINGDLPEPTLRHAAFHKPITLANPPNAYTAPGIEGLTDGYVSEAANFLALEWLGFEGRAFDATLDLGAVVPIRTVGADFLQEMRGGIQVPHTVDVFASDDGKTFKQVGSIKNAVDSEARYLRRLSVELQDVQARYIRLLAHPSGQWLFVDEVFVDPTGATADEH